MLAHTTVLVTTVQCWVGATPLALLKLHHGSARTSMASQNKPCTKHSNDGINMYVSPPLLATKPALIRQPLPIF